MDYPDYIKDEAIRRLNKSLEEVTKGCVAPSLSFSPHTASHRALAELLIEQGFKPPVDPLIEEVFEIACLTGARAVGSEEDILQDFVGRLKAKGLTITVTKKT